MGFVENIINKVINFGNKDSKTVSDILNNNKVINADQAYRYTRFGEFKSDKKLLEDFFYELNHMVDARNARGKFYGIIDVDIDIQKYLPLIMNKLRDELGFKVIVMDDDTVIKNNNEEIKLNGGGKFIMLLWNRESIKDVQEHMYTEEVLGSGNMPKQEEVNQSEDTSL